MGMGVKMRFSMNRRKLEGTSSCGADLNPGYKSSPITINIIPLMFPFL